MITALVPSPALDVTYLIDDFAVGGIFRPGAALTLAGGKGINLARAARTLGGSAQVVTALGGRSGERLADLARAEGITVTAVPVETETRLCISVVGDEITEIYERATPLDIEALVAAAPEHGRLVLSGSVNGDVSRLAGREVAVDTSGAGLRQLIELGVPLVKVNRFEAAEVVGRQDSALELAREIYARGVATVVVTDGAAGSVAVDADGCWLVEPDPEPGRFSVGSGDSFFAGLLVALEDGDALSDALRLAAAAGSANTRQPGAGRFSRGDLRAAFGRITVRPVG